MFPLFNLLNSKPITENVDKKKLIEDLEKLRGEVRIHAFIVIMLYWENDEKREGEYPYSCVSKSSESYTFNHTQFPLKLDSILHNLIIMNNENLELIEQKSKIESEKKKIHNNISNSQNKKVNVISFSKKKS